MKNHQSNRYQETDLAEFKKVIEKKLAKAEKQVASLIAQLQENSAHKGSQSDWVDDSSSSANLQLLDTMANRLRKHIVDLKNALLRIHNKSYGICSLTGELIDKKRLLAVPTTTKSVAAKTADKKNGPKRRVTTKTPKIISRVIRKNDSSTKKETKPNLIPNLEEDDNLLDDVENLDLKEEMED